MNTKALTIRNPFGVADAPDPEAHDVLAFAATVQLDGGPLDPNAQAWPGAAATPASSLAGAWSSRWNGGADPAITGDTPELWKRGRATLALQGDRIYILFDWNNGAGQGLLEALRDGDRCHGRYVNLGDTSIVRPWSGLIVDNTRIDGRWTLGRLDFHR